MPATSYSMDGNPMLYYQTIHIGNTNATVGPVTCTKIVQPDGSIILKIKILLDESYYQSTQKTTVVYTFGSGARFELRTRKTNFGEYAIFLYGLDSTGYEYFQYLQYLSEAQMTVIRNLSFTPSIMVAPYYRDYISHPATEPDDTYKTRIGIWYYTNYIWGNNSMPPQTYGHYNLPTNGDNYEFPDMSVFVNRQIQGTDASWVNFDIQNVYDINPLLIFSNGGTWDETNVKVRNFTWMSNTGYSVDITDSVSNSNRFLFDIIKPSGSWVDPNDDDDPMNGGGNSDRDNAIGGHGTFDYTSDVIPPPNLPTLTATASGFVKIYNPTQAQLKDISNYCWSNDVIKNALQAIFGNPINGIISLHTIPSNIPNAEAGYFAIAGIASTDILVNLPTSQYVTVDCGNLEIKEFTGTFLDYSPHTKCTIYLPYLGYRDLSVDEIMGKTLSIKYIIDIVNGSFVCFIQANGSLITQYNGNCAMTVPMTSIDYTSFFTNTVSMASTIAGGYMAGNPTGHAINSMMSAGNVMASKPEISKSGNFGGSTGIIGYQRPYLIITTPAQNKPSQQKEIFGYPCNMSKKLGSLKGYTKVSDIKLEKIQCTDEEKREIMTLLKGGVFI
jgi:hypothetical protein